MFIPYRGSLCHTSNCMQSHSYECHIFNFLDTALDELLAEAGFPMPWPHDAVPQVSISQEFFLLLIHVLLPLLYFISSLLQNEWALDSFFPLCYRPLLLFLWHAQFLIFSKGWMTCFSSSVNKNIRYCTCWKFHPSLRDGLWISARISFALLLATKASMYSNNFQPTFWSIDYE